MLAIRVWRDAWTLLVILRCLRWLKRWWSAVSFRRLRQTEIQYLHGARGRDLHIGRLDVAVKDALLVGGNQASALDGEVEKLFRLEGLGPRFGA